MFEYINAGKSAKVGNSNRFSKAVYSFMLVCVCLCVCQGKEKKNLQSKVRKAINFSSQDMAVNMWDCSLHCLVWFHRGKRPVTERLSLCSIDFCCDY